MSWKDPEPVVIKYDIQVLLRKETIWTCHYFEPDRWKKDLEEVYYELAAEYEPDEHTIVKRWELDESKRDKLAPGASHFQTVIFDRRKAVVKKQDP